MQLALKRLATLIAGMIVAATLAGGAAAKTPITRIERCNSLQQQYDHAVVSEHARAKRATQAGELQKKAAKFCAGKSQAQGIRAYAKALKLLGVKPIDR